MGEHDTTDSEADIRTISAITDPPDYDSSNSFANDFSILTLAEPLTFSSVVAPVCLPSLVSSLYTGEVATVTGWGRTTMGGSVSPVLLETNQTVLSNEQCDNAYTQYNIQEYISSS